MALARGWRRVSEAESAATRGVEAIGQAFQQLLKMRLVDEARTLSQLCVRPRTPCVDESVLVLGES
jgi:hypothetical protein